MASVSGSLMMILLPLPDLRVDLDDAFEFLDVRAHDVHADAAAGDIRDLCRGAEAGCKNEVEGLVFDISRAWASVIIPFSMAFAFSFSGSMPRPSSSIEMTMWFPSCSARTVIVPVRICLPHGGPQSIPRRDQRRCA